MPADRPILFSGSMVKAILAGRKTQTRRIMRPQPESWFPPFWGEVPGRPGTWVPWTAPEGSVPRAARAENAIRCPYGAAGDTLWVREAWRFVDFEHVDGLFSAAVEMRADMARPVRRFGGEEMMNERTGWRPSIHMPRWASRLTLEVEEVRVQRLLDITEEDAAAEGVTYDPPGSGLFPYRDAFACLWDRINGERGYPWASNPWVWCVTFRRVEVPCE